MTDQLAVGLTLAGIVVGLISAAYGAWRHYRPSVKRAGAALDAIIGTEAVTDRSGKEIEPAKPGLVHRTRTLEQTLATLVDQDVRLKHLEDGHSRIDARVKALEDNRVERLINQAESAHMWRAVADSAAPGVEDGE